MNDDFESADGSSSPPLDNMHAGTGANGGPPRTLWPTTLAAIERAGYELQTHIRGGDGASAIVVEGKEHGTDRRVALKVIYDPAHARSMAMFRRENRILASRRLPSDLVVQYYNSRQEPGCQPFLVLELIEGRKIHHYVSEQQSMPTLARIGLFEQSTTAWSAAIRSWVPR